MILQSYSTFGTPLPIQISSILEKSNSTWGCNEEDLRRHEGQLAFSLYVYLGGLHVDLGAPEEMTGAAVQLLHRYGLPRYIKATSSLYDLCVRSGSFDFHQVTDEMKVILGCDPSWITFCTYFGSWRQSSMMKAWALRFLKRFTVSNATKLRTECLRKFVSTDARNRQFDEHSDTHLKYEIEELASDYLAWLLEDFDLYRVLNSIFEDWAFDPTPNAVNHCCEDRRHRVLKVLAWLGVLPSTSEPELFSSDLGLIDTGERLISNVTSVPKDYKTYRIVSPDDPINLAFQQAIVKEINRCLKEKGMMNNLPLHDQGIMRNITYRSVTGDGPNYATLDMSSASDTVRLSLARRLMRADIMKVIDMFRPKWYDVTDLQIRERLMYMLAPMGSAYTLLLESCIFWALDSATCHYSAVISGDVKSLGCKRKWKNSWLYPFACYAMGDDQQVPVEWAESCIEILQLEGFIVNASKSFYDADALFRESCGAEALGEEPIDGFYIPRHSLSLYARKGSVKGKPTDQARIEILYDLAFVNPNRVWVDRDREGNAVPKTDVTAIIAMSKVFMELGLSHMGRKISHWILASIPSMTASEFGEPADDVWDTSEQVYSYMKLPFGYFEDEECVKFTQRFHVPYTGITRTLFKSEDDFHTEYARPVHWSMASVSKRLLPLSVLPSHMRDQSECPICRWLTTGTRVFIANEALEAYRYQTWLRKGPNYQSELDRLLGVSSPSPSLDVISQLKVSAKY